MGKGKKKAKSNAGCEEYFIQEFKTLTIANDFMFGAVMRNEELCRQFLECVLEIPIDHVEFVNSQQTIDVAPDMKSVRLDVYVKDGKGTVYDVEIQVSTNRNLPLRIRYYHSVADTDNLEKGMDYLDLPQSFVIFICTFDPIGTGRAYYSFSTRCDQDSDIVLDDKRRTILLNTKGNDESISDELRELLDYFNGKEGETPLVKALDEEVKRKRKSKKLKEAYMTVQMRERELIREGEARGEARGAVMGAIETLRDFDTPEAEIARRIKAKYHLTDEQVDEYLGVLA